MTSPTETAASAAVVIERLPVGAADASMGLVTLNRPELMNAVDWEIGLALGEALDELAGDPTVRVIAITGAGRAFSAGGDMEKYRALQRDPEAFPRFLADMQRMLGGISRIPKPCIALVNGVAVAGGFELLLACDVVFAAESARLGDAHLPYGQMGGGGVLTLLPRTVGPNRARELILSGRLLDAKEALTWGLVSRVVPDDQLLDAGLEFAGDVAMKSPLGVANAKSVLNSSFWEGTGIEAGMRLELEVVSRYCLTSEDAPEGLDAFAAKRTPTYVGR